MNKDAAISRYGGGDLGTVLVLFILLVIVMSVFCAGMKECDPPDATAASRFQINNTTTAYNFFLSSPTNVPALPTRIDYTRSPDFVISGTVTAEYNIRDLYNRDAGSFSLTMQSGTGITNSRKTGNFLLIVDNNNFYAYKLSVYRYA